MTTSANEDELLHATGMLRNTMDYLDAADELRTGKTKLSKHVESLWLAYGTGDISLD